MNNEKLSMGWLPDYPDFRDYTQEHEKINKIITPTGVLKKLNCQHQLI